MIWLRIALVPEYFHPEVGGGENWFKNIGSELVRRGHRVVVFAQPRFKAPEDEIIDGISVKRVGIPVLGRRDPYLRSAFSLVFHLLSDPIHASRYDVVVGQGSALTGRLPVLWAKHIPTICVIHDIYGLHGSIQNKGYVKGILRHLALEKILPRLPITQWVAVSETTRRKLKFLGISARRIGVVRNGVTWSESQHLRQKERSSITYLGRLVRHKHPEDFIQAVSHVEPGLPWVANVAGEGELLGDLRELTYRLGLQSRISFLGRVSDEQKVELLSSSVCVVLPSLAEGWGTVLTEAAAVGTPSIAYDIPAIREQAALVPSILLVKPRDVSGLASRIEHLLRSPEYVKQLSEAGRIAVRGLTWKASADQFEKLLSEMLFREGLLVRVSPQHRNIA